MPCTITFLNQKLYQSISFDADIKFPNISEYAKKIWVLNEYKKANVEFDLTEKNQKTNSRELIPLIRLKNLLRGMSLLFR